MRGYSIILFCLVFITSKSLSGQCPNRDSVLKRIELLHNSTSINYNDQLKELLGYESRMKNCPQYIDSVYTFLLLNIGVTYYKLSDFVHAIQYTRQALNIIQENTRDGSMNKTILNKYYYYLSIYYDSLKMPSRKNEAIDSCISNELKINTDYHFASLVLQSNVRDLYNKGDYYLCVERATLGETLIHKFYRYDDSLNYIIFYVYYKANALRSLLKYSEAEQFLYSKQKQLSKSSDKDYTGIIYGLFGYLYESRGEYKKAIKYFQKAFYFDKQTTSKQISAAVLSEIGKIYFEKLNQDRLAIRYYYQALSHANKQTLANASVSDSFYIFGNIANVYARLKLFDSAYYFFQKAFDKIKPGMNEMKLVLDIENYVIANTVEVVIKLVLDKANTYLQQFNNDKNPVSLNNALSIYKSADHLLSKIKDEQTEIQSRLFWQMDVHSLYEHAVEVAYLQNNSNDAFYFFEKSRAVILNEQLNKQNGINNEDILNEAKIKKKILLLERERETMDVSSSQYIEVQKQLIIDKQALDRLEQIIIKRNPLFYKNSRDTAFITLQDFKKESLPDHEALLEIFSGDSSVYSLFITQKNIYFNKINKTNFDSTASSYISFLSNPVLLNSQYDNFIKTASHLYRLIFNNNPVPDGRIIISPDGKIFPFEALITQVNGGDPVYFLNSHAVSYTYSGGYLLTRFAADTSNKPVNFLGVAPVRYKSYKTLADLDGSAQSLRQIETNFSNSFSLVNNDASKGNFQQQYSNCSIIQLYTHSSDTSNRGEPVIYFADSALYLSDLIPENKPKTRLIVLSACETGNGVLFQGEGIFSFNRGFASLGIPSSITNLWSVDNKSTYQITELFYKYLSKGLPIDVALQKAKLEFIETGSRKYGMPYYWAAAVLTGKSDAIKYDKSFPAKDISMILILAGLTFFVLWKWGKRKKLNFVNKS
jgi:CHAT domain-containing protein/tetratricopeptide (TPR) repeat protein